MAEMDDDELLNALGVETPALTTSRHTPREERIIAGFEDVLRFHQTHGRAPQHGEDKDIFERLYAVRLDQLRKLPEAPALLSGLDTAGLLNAAGQASIDADAMDEDALLAQLGVNADGTAGNDITVLRNVRPYASIKAAEQIASRTPCANFSDFKPLFDEAIAGLKTGSWIEQPYIKNAGVEMGDFFIVGGQVAYVASSISQGKTSDGRPNPRIRVIFDNGTEADLLLRSLSRSLYPDGDVPVGRRLLKLDHGPLFSNTADPDDIKSGTIYVLRSESKHPFVVEHRELIHKIGVTGGDVKKRIADAEKDATYLLSNVEVVATYGLHNANRSKLEHVLHRLFSAAQLDLTIEDRFGTPVKPREWFLVPLHVIDEAIRRVLDGSLVDVVYDMQTATLVPTKLTPPTASPT
jgi:T5orf172 domain